MLALTSSTREQQTHMTLITLVNPADNNYNVINLYNIKNLIKVTIRACNTVTTVIRQSKLGTQL